MVYAAFLFMCDVLMSPRTLLVASMRVYIKKTNSDLLSHSYPLAYAKR